MPQVSGVSGLVDHSALQNVLVLLEQHHFHMMKCKVWQARARKVFRLVGRRHAHLGRSDREKDVARVKVQNPLAKSSQGPAATDASGKDRAVGMGG